MNFYTKGGELYVDELDLGDWYSLMNWRPEPEHYKGNAFMLLDQEHNAIYTQNYVHQTAYQQWRTRWWSNAEGSGSNNATDKGVMFPVINESASYREGTNNAEANNMEGSGVIVNGYVLRKDGDNNQYYPEFRYSWPGGQATKVPQVIPSFQPMLVMMIAKVLEAAGYPLTNDSEIALLQNSLFRHIFIVTANNRIELNKALPHWTVNEFITQVEHLLGIVIDVDTVIDDDVDEYQVEINKEETTDITNGNVGFSDIEDGYEHISDDIMTAVPVNKTRWTTIAGMQESLSVGAVHREHKGQIYEVQGHQFIVVDNNGYYEFREVNQLRMLQRVQDKRDVDVELKIVPCPITQWECPYVETSQGNDGKYTDTVRGSVTVDVFTRPDIEHVGTDSVSTDDEEIDIEALIEGEQDIPSKEDTSDLMYIGVLPAACTYNQYPIPHYWPRPISWHQWKVTSSGIDPGNSVQQREFLVLNKTTSEWTDKTLYTESMETSSVIDTTVKHCIKFISSEVLRPGGAFVIHGQLFACEKLEYSITNKGVSRLVTGYFYRLS